MGQFFGFAVYWLFVQCFRFVPFWLLYALSDFLNWSIYGVFGYRKKVVFENLKRAFPEQSEAERAALAKEFYSHFFDLLLEVAKGATMGKKALLKRVTVENLECVQEFYDKGQNVIVALAHHNNWEWGSRVASLYFKHPTKVLYKPLSNKLIDKSIQETRKGWGAEMWSIFETRKLFETDFGEPFLVGMAADQCPSNTKKSYWVDFFNTETPFLHGPEYYARKYNLPLIFCEIEKPKRGHYHGKFSVLHEGSAADKPEGYLTQLYARRTEEAIRRAPAYWLWTHRRWKRMRKQEN